MSPRAVSLVMPNYNHAATLRACIERIFETTKRPQWELIVVDDGSTDDSLEVLSRIKGIQLIRQSHQGVARALNTGFAAARHNDVVRIHSDVLVETPDWLALLVEASEQQPKAGVVGVKLVYPDNRIQAVGRNILTGIGWHSRHCEQMAFQLDSSRPGPVQEVDSVPGALAYYRREILEATGGVDENYWPEWTNDDDLCMAARFHNYKVYVQPAIKAIHLTRTWSPTSGVYFRDQLPRIKKLTWEIKETVRKQHAAYWEKKWGWNPMYPDLNEVRRLYGHTEICWRMGETLRFRSADWPPTVDACMVTWNNLAVLRRCLESLAQTDYPKDRLQIWITDNASKDGTSEYLSKLASTFPFRLQVATLPVNTGCPAGMNWAMAQGQAQLVARLDDDILLPTDWLHRLAEDFRRRPFAGVVGPKIINDDEKQAIQCSDYALFPTLFGHDDEVDRGQIDYLARTAHVRGCCNVYRRDALNRCGLLDIRYSPSQCDDPDHQLAVIEAGYEVIYDGHVRVAHKLTNGVIRSQAAITNQQGNQQKMYGKWGGNIYEVVDKTLDFSREGRYLPDDGNTAEYMAKGPKLEEFPRKVEASLTHADRDFGTTAVTWLNRRESDPEYVELIKDHLGLAASLRRDGHPRHALDILHTALNLAPETPAVFSALIETYQTLGDTEQANRLLAIYQRLDQGKTVIAGEAPPSTSQGTRQITDQYTAIGEAKSAVVVLEHPKCRVLMVNTYESRAAGGDMVQIKKTKEYLEHLGVTVDINCSARPDPRGYDLVHLWNLWFPHQTLRQLKAIRLINPSIPVVLSPIYWDMSEKAWADQVVPQLFADAVGEKQLGQDLEKLAADQLLAGGVRRLKHVEPNYSGYETYQKQIIEMVDCLLPLSYAEMRSLEKTLGILKPYAVVRNAAEPGVFESATPDRFVNQYGLRDFVLAVGLIEPRKNQLMLLHALRDANLPIVVVGRNYDRNYLRLCKKFAHPKTLFIEHMPHELLASAYKAARVHALPSWAECAALVNIEAALSGCALAVSNRTSEPEYFQDAAYYCDPASIDSIREAVLSAYRNHPRDAAKRQRLRERFLHDYTWDRAAEQTFRCYQEALKRKGQAPASNAAKADLQRLELPDSIYAKPLATSVEATPPRVSIVIPTFNRLELTRRCLAALQDSTPPEQYEIIVVDNGSTAGAGDFLNAEETGGRLRLMRNDENLGFAKACNQGSKAARGKYLLFLNNDTEVQPGWLAPLLSLADADPAVAAVGSKLLFPDGSIQHAGVALGEVAGRDPLLAVHTFYKASAELPAANQRRVYQALTAACLLVRRAAFEAVGGFDEAFWNGYEDVDLCLRLQERGWLMVYEPASRVVHHESQSGPARFQKVQENIRRLHQKWLGKAGLDVVVSADGNITPAETSRIRPYTPPATAAPLTSIIVLAHNQLAHTKFCLEGLNRHTPEPHELILVDNNSTDGTLDYFREVAAKHENVRVISNRTNHGFAVGNNQGLSIVRGDIVVLLNNDTVVSPGWLQHMLAVLEAHPDVGLVGPVSNRVSGPQLVSPVNYKELSEIPAFAEHRAAVFAGRSVPATRLVGFCLLARRAVIEQIGGLDEQFGSGNFEDDDFCLRARQAGFGARIALDAFVHHAGGQTFKGAGIDYRQAMLRNWSLFKAKWGLPADAPVEQGYPTPSHLPEGRPLKVPLPHLALDHKPDAAQRWWEEASPPPRVSKDQKELPQSAKVGSLSEAAARLREKNFAAAWQAALTAQQARPFHPEAFLLLAEIAQAAGDSVAARQCAAHAQQLAPGWKAPKQFLKANPRGNTKHDWLVLPEEVRNPTSDVRSRLSVCLIVKNEERFLAQCLKSVRDLAHQIVVVDTGSTDRTAEIAKEHGAEVHPFPWSDDFSAARNAALERATGDWVLVLDADEELPAASREALRKEMQAAKVMAYRLPIADAGRENEGCSYVPRLFRNAPGLFFIGRVHEHAFGSVEARRKPWGLENRLGTTRLLHHGYTGDVTRDRDKVRRNLRLLELALAESPEDPNLVMNVGLELVRLGNLAGGLARYREAFRLASALPPAQVSPELRETLLTQFCTHLTAAGLPDELIRVLDSPLAKSSSLTASLHFALGLAHIQMGQFSEAAAQMRQCLAKRHQPGLTPVNQEIHRGGPHHCLAQCLAKLQQNEAADEAFRAGLAEAPQARPLRLDYARFLWTQGRPVDGLHLLHALVTERPDDVEAWRLGGEIALSRAEFLEFAADWTGEAIRQLPGDPQVIAQRAEVLMLRQEVLAAQDLWRQICQQTAHPRHQAAWILCETLSLQSAGAAHAGLDEVQTSRAFVEWYRRLVDMGAAGQVACLNSRRDHLRQVLPTASRVLDAVVAEVERG